MKRRETIFDFLVQIFMIFGITILCLNVFVVLFGEDAKEYSTMFEMGGRGLTTATMIQFLGVSVVTVLLKFLFFTDKIIKNRIKEENPLKSAQKSRVKFMDCAELLTSN